MDSYNSLHVLTVLFLPISFTLQIVLFSAWSEMKHPEQKMHGTISRLVEYYLFSKIHI